MLRSRPLAEHHSWNRFHGVTAERDQLLVLARTAATSDETMFEASALEVVLEFSRDEIGPCAPGLMDALAQCR